MKKSYLYENELIQQISNETYPELMAALKIRNPKAQELIEDAEFSQLHALLVLLRLKQIRIRELDVSSNLLIILEICEENRTTNEVAP